MALTLLFKVQKTKIDSLTLDASVSETHQTEIEVTDHPVEYGSDISDHRRLKPAQITIEGLVTNTPLPDDGAPEGDQTYSQGAQAFTWRSKASAAPTRVRTAYQALLDLASSDTLITIVTSLHTYPAMTMTSLSIPRDAKTGQVLRFTATFREIKIVQNSVVQVQAKTTRATPNTDLHKKTPPTAPTPAKRQSVLHWAGHGLSDAGIGKSPLGALVDAATGTH